MAATYWDNNAGGGDNTYTTDSQWSTGSDPVTGDNAIFTDVRSSANVNGENVQNPTWPDNIWFTKYSGNVGSSGTHLEIDDAAGSETLGELRIENCTGKFYLDFEQASGANTVTDTHINVPGMASDQINLGGAAAFTNMHLLRGRTNLGMTGTITNLWSAYSTTPRDVHADIAAGATVTNVYQGGGRIVSASSNSVTLWMQRGGSTQLTGSGTIADYFLNGGNLRVDGSGTALIITDLFVNAGIVDFTKTGNVRTVTNVYVQPGATVDFRGVENLVATTKIVVYGSGRVLGKQPTQTFA